MMTAWDYLLRLRQKEATHLDQPELLPDHILPAQPTATALAAGDGYFQIWAVQMFLQRDREWFTNWYPVVHAWTQFSYADEPKPIEIAQIAGPTHLRTLSPDKLEQIVQLDLPLTPLLPYNGGLVSIEAGMLAMKSGRTLEGFVDVMSKLAKLVAVPQISSTLNMIGAVTDGVNQLLSVSDCNLVLGLNRTFQGAGGGGSNVLSPAYFVIFRAPSGSFRSERLWMRNSNLLYGESLEAAHALTGVTYLVLRIDTCSYREDWDRLNAINQPFTQAIKALTTVDAQGNPQFAQAETYIRAAAGAALTSADLASRDRSQVAQAILKRYDKYKASLFGDRDLDEVAIPTPPPSLAEVAMTAREIPATPITLEQLFAKS